MTEYERMVKGLLYNPGDEEILNEQFPFLDKLWNFNQLKPSDFEKKTAYMKEVFAECGENCYIELPFRANWGGHHVHFGSNIYANSNFTCVDDGHIYIGDKVMIGPNVANAVILPGVKIGKNVVIGAGSIVTKDIPDNVIAVGNPCHILREVGEHDREFFYKDEKIDWENLQGAEDLR